MGAVDLFTLSLSRLITIRAVSTLLLAWVPGGRFQSMIYTSVTVGPAADGLLPHTHSPNELWLPILCKALLKVIGLR